jgi:GNAT superfamily N-acetyltransferase
VIGVIRPGTADDLPQITIVRTSVRENHLSVEQMAAAGITPQSIAEQMRSGELKCWVAEQDDVIVGFSMADRDTANIFALFILPAFEGRGLGSMLLAACENWLRELGHTHAILNTEPGTRAIEFYRRKEWIETGTVSTLFAQDMMMRKML